MSTPRASRVAALASIILLTLAAALAGCGSHATRATAPIATTTPAPERDVAMAAAIAEQERVSADLMSTAGVVGTGASLDAAGRAEVLVLLESSGVTGIPRTSGGLPVETMVVGTLRPWALNTRYRPLPIGVSAGNVNQCVPGTIGCVLLRGGKQYLLSANHVLARQNQAAIGEAVSQPAPPDLDPACGTIGSSAYVANLSDFQPVNYDGKTSNTMDAAIAAVSLPPGQVTGATPHGYYGMPSTAVRDPAVHLGVMKLGRGTGLTRGEVKSVNVKVKITFPSGTALFSGQFLTSPSFGGFGDSGALVVTDDTAVNPSGMVIGGGNNGSAIVTPIRPILQRFNATVYGR